MSLTQAIATALSGLRVSQSGLSLVASNVANADTPGYTRKIANQVPNASGGIENGVRLAGIKRTLDQFVQRQLRTEQAGGAYASTRADYLARLDQIFGAPGSSNALNTQYDAFLGSLQDLSAAPESISRRAEVLNAARSLAQHLNGMTADLQDLRSQAEQGIGQAVDRINSLLSGIEKVNTQIIGQSGLDGGSAALLDERDRYIAELSELMDIRVVEADRGGISIFTSSGISLFNFQAAKLGFDGRAVLDANAQWTETATTRGVGTITLTGPSGNAVDLIAGNAIRSGKLAAMVEMRDATLVEAQAQLDAMAAAMADALSGREIAGAAATVGPANGFEIDTASLQDGNVIRLRWTETPGGTVHNVSIVRVDDAGALPLAATATPDPNDEVIGVNFAGGLAGVVTALNTYFGANVAVSNPSGTTLRFLDDGAGGASDVNALSAHVTTTSLTGGTAELPFFVDGGSGSNFTGRFTQFGPQERGFAGRIAVNGALFADPSRLVVLQTVPPTAASDPTRPNFLRDRMTSGVRSFTSTAGVGTTSSPYSGTIGDYMAETISRQSLQVETGKRLAEGQEMVVNSLRERFAERSGVDIDQEMSKLLQLQTAYGASARILTAIKDMFDTLIRM